MRPAILTVMIMLIFSASALADGVMIPHPAPWLPPKPTVDVKYHYVDVEINDPVALTKIDQVFVNPYRREIEADFIFPIPEDAAISRFVAWLGGRKMEAELLDADQARKVYEDIVRRRKDPALLEYAGRGIYRLRIYPIPPKGEVRIEIEYEQTLKSGNGTVEYIYPLNTEKYSGSNLEECKVDIRINSFEDIGALYCPTHNISSERYGDRSMRAIYQDENVRPDRDLILYFTRQRKDFGFHLLSYKEPKENNGFFLGIISPPLKSRLSEVDKNIIFVLDSSGSMRGKKFDQAVAALKFVLQGLNSGDDFNIIDYDDTINPFKPNLVSANSDNLNAAIKFAEDLEAEGGTNIYDALAEACRIIPRDGDPTYIMFLTDGQPTVGNTDINQIIKNTTALNEARARLFVFGVGYDVNAHLLDRLSQENKGVSDYVLPGEDIEVKISRLASKISHPALTDLALAFSGTGSYQIYPDPLPDLFYGSEIIITGRYKGSGKSDDHAVIHGKVGSVEVNYEFPVTFSDGSHKDEFIALLWANRRIGYLLQQMRLHGTSDELLAEVIKLSKKYGILTEYTSFLVTGDEHMRAEEIWFMPPSAISGKLGSSMNRLTTRQTGRSAVTQSKALAEQAFSAQVAPSGVITIGGEKQRYDNITQVGAQGFFKAGDNWIQGDLEDDRLDIKIKRFSPAYFQILEKDPSLGRYLGLGDEVRLQIGNLIVQIADDGKEFLTDSELEALFIG